MSKGRSVTAKDGAEEQRTDRIAAKDGAEPLYFWATVKRWNKLDIKTFYFAPNSTI